MALGPHPRHGPGLHAFMAPRPAKPKRPTFMGRVSRLGWKTEYLFLTWCVCTSVRVTDRIMCGIAGPNDSASTSERGRTLSALLLPVWTRPESSFSPPTGQGSGGTPAPQMAASLHPVTARHLRDVWPRLVDIRVKLCPVLWDLWDGGHPLLDSTVCAGRTGLLTCISSSLRKEVSPKPKLLERWTCEGRQSSQSLDRTSPESTTDLGHSVQGSCRSIQPKACQFITCLTNASYSFSGSATINVPQKVLPHPCPPRTSEGCLPRCSHDG